MPFINLGGSRQQRLYVHLFEIYRATGRNAAGDPAYELVHSKVKGYLFATSNADTSTPVGQIKKDIAIMLDEIHFEADTDVRAEDILRHVTPRHGDNGTWYSVTGEPMVRESTERRKPNVCEVFVNKTVEPPLAA